MAIIWSWIIPRDEPLLAAAVYAVGYAVGIAAFLLMAKRRKLLTTGVFHAMVAGLIGGLLVANAIQWIITGAPGKTIIGGIAGGWLSVELYKRHIGLKRSLGDLFAVAISAGEESGDGDVLSAAAATAALRMSRGQSGSTTHGVILPRHTFPSAALRRFPC